MSQLSGPQCCTEESEQVLPVVQALVAVMPSLPGVVEDTTACATPLASVVASLDTNAPSPASLHVTAAPATGAPVLSSTSAENVL
jgi:hypothetical protein